MANTTREAEPAIAGPPFGPQPRNTSTLPGLQLALLHAADRVRHIVVHNRACRRSGRPVPGRCRPGLHDGALGRERATEHDDRGAPRERSVERTNHIRVRGRRRREVVAKRAPGDRARIEIEQRRQLHAAARGRRRRLRTRRSCRRRWAPPRSAPGPARPAR